VSEQSTPNPTAATPPAGAGAAREALEPTRDPQATLSDLIDVLLNKGVYLDLDLVITVADIPLIGVSLRAAIAGMETMLEYGMMSGLDERTRSALQQSAARQLPLRDGEELVARMAGSHHWQDAASSFSAWRPGAVIVTSERLLVFRRDPAAILWEAELADIASLEVRRERTAGGEPQQIVAVSTRDGALHSLTAAQPERLRELVRPGRSALTDADAAAPRDRAKSDEEAAPLFEAPLWYFEPRRGTGEWRGGTGTCDVTGGFTWKGPIDQRASIRLPIETIRSIEVVEGRTPVGQSVLVVDAEGGTFHLASDRVEQWALLLRGLVRSHADSGAQDQEARHDASD
jgi:Gas vesicle protein